MSSGVVDLGNTFGPPVVSTINGQSGAVTIAGAGDIAVNTSGPAITISDTLVKGNLTDVGTDGIAITNGTGAVIGSGTSIAQHIADSTHNGYLSAADWVTFNNKLSPSFSNYISNPDAETDTSGWNLYSNQGNPATAYVIISDITFTAVAVAAAGNGINIDYVFHPTQSYTTPLVTVVSSTHVTVAWYNGPTVANNPTATQLKTAWDAVPGAVALATSAITGNPNGLQYITGSHLTANGGDTTPTTGSGGVPTGVTFTRNTTTPLVGIASFDLGKDAVNRQGDGVSTDFIINTLDKGKELQVAFAYQGSSNMNFGTGSDVQVFIYDLTNAVLIPVTPLRTLAGPINSAKEYVGKFLSVTTSVSYRLILHIATTNTSAWDILLDNVTVNDQVAPGATTQVPSLVLSAQPISGSVTDRMVVMWTDGASSWVPATQVLGSNPITDLGFATNIVGLVADVFVDGYMGGFSFGPFAGFNQYIDNTAGSISPLPSPFTDTYVGVGKAISATELLINFYRHVDLITSKGGLLTSNGANNGNGDVVLPVGANGNVLVANSAAADGIQWAPAVVTAAPFTYTTATRTLSMSTLPIANGGTGNTVGSAATLTTPRTIAGTSFNGSANITLANKFIVQGTTDAGLSGPQFLGALATGLVKNTTTTGVLSIAAASDVTGQLITGYVSGAGVVAATDSILQSINKLNGNAALLAPKASPVFTGDVNSSTGNVLISTLGKGLQVKSGVNSRIGTAVLVAGTVTVTNTSTTANSRIFITANADGGTPGWHRVSTITVGTSFVITSSSVTDTSTVAWIIIESI